MQERRIKGKKKPTQFHYFKFITFKRSLLIKKVASDMLLCITSMQINEQKMISWGHLYWFWNRFQDYKKFNSTENLNINHTWSYVMCWTKK